MPTISTYIEFPICLQEVSSSDVGKKTDYPAGIDEQTLHKWWYRVRDWELDLNFTLHVNASVTGESAGADASLEHLNPFLQTIPSGLSNENGLTCSSPFYFFSVGSFSDNNSDSEPEAYATAQTNFDNSSSGTAVLSFSNTKKVGDLYYPRVELNFSLQLWGAAYSDGGTVDCVSTLSSHPFTGTPGDFDYPVDVTLIIDGQSFVTEFSMNKLRFVDGTGSFTEGIAVNAITLRPKRYWEHDPGDGLGPVYDEDTGEELRDPLSV